MVLCLHGAWNPRVGVRVTHLTCGKRGCSSSPVLPTAKNPLDSLLVTGSPYGQRNRERPPGDGFCQSRGWPVSGQDAGPGRLRAGSPTRSLPRGNGPHPGHIRPAPQGPWGRVRGTGSSPRHPEVRSFSRGPHLPARLPPRQRQSAREELGTWDREEGPATVPGQVGRARASGTHAQGPGLPGGLGPETCPGG